MLLRKHPDAMKNLFVDCHEKLTFENSDHCMILNTVKLVPTTDQLRKIRCSVLKRF